MAGMPAARRLDLTVHVPVIIITGSPDTKICYLPAARLNDIATPCPLPPCKPPQGKIVSSSKTVFINGLGAARIGDYVLDSAAASPPGPGGCSHPAAQGYEARPADHYEKIIEIEHEASDWDEVDEKERKPYDGKRDKVETPVGIVPSGAGAAKPKKKGKAQPYPGGESSSSAWGGGGGEAGASLPSGGGAKLGESASGGLGADAVDQPEAARKKQPKKLDLKFPIDLKFGSRSGRAGYAPAPNKIALGCFTVIVG
ncbi:MAG: PAAR domain-containing protein [Deltaproteobacteria bacterium]|nr:PAAR domain-containing protein [Deltaproteobacteria bacterium]